jgi:hypothetical protein
VYAGGVVGTPAQRESGPEDRDETPLGLSKPSIHILSRHVSSGVLLMLPQAECRRVGLLQKKRTQAC